MSKHTRTAEALARREQRRATAKLLYDTAFIDRERAEFVCLLDEQQITRHLEIQFGHSETEFTLHEKGEVIHDNKGRGTLQQVDKDSVI
jgi:hypothetical protein